MIEKLYAVRHGQTDWNAQHKIMGTVDIDLNRTGIQQAETTRDELQIVQFSVILTSPLRRARQTANIIAEKHPHVPFIVESRLRERNFGIYEGKVNDGNYYGLWNYDNDNIPDGQTPAELYDQIRSLLDEISKQYSGNVLLVSHGGVGLMIEAYFRGIPEDRDLLQYVSGNGEVKVYDMEHGNL